MFNIVTLLLVFCVFVKTVWKFLGKEQAEMTGKRLKALNMPINRIVISTMTRAQETGKIISKFFPDIEPEHCDLIREGAPIPPEPRWVGHWCPESEVIGILCNFFNSLYLKDIAVRSRAQTQ